MVAGDAASDLEAALTKALDETLMSSCFYNLGLCKASRAAAAATGSTRGPLTRPSQVRLGQFEAAARALNAAGTFLNPDYNTAAL